MLYSSAINQPSSALYASAINQPSSALYSSAITMPTSSFVGGATPSLYASAMAAPIYTPSQPVIENPQRAPPAAETPSFPAGAVVRSNANLYASTPGLPLFSSMHVAPSVQLGPNSIYASMPALPPAPVAPKGKESTKAAKKAVVSEGNMTVGLMIWPTGPKEELVVTGLKEGTSAVNCGLKVRLTVA